MSIVVAAARELMALGASGEALLAALARIEEAVVVEHAKSVQQAVEIASRKEDAKLAHRKAKAAERTRKWREAKDADPSVTVISPSVTEDHGDGQGAPAAAALAHVEDTSLPSLRSEEITPRLPSVATPPKAKSTSKPSRRCPEAWLPSERCRQLLAGEGHEAGDLERALTRMRDHEFKTARSDWDATFRNWVREDRDRRKQIRPDPANSRSARRGVWAEIAAEERGEGPGLLTGPS